MSIMTGAIVGMVSGVLLRAIFLLTKARKSYRDNQLAVESELVELDKLKKEMVEQHAILVAAINRIKPVTPPSPEPAQLRVSVSKHVLH